MTPHRKAKTHPTYTKEDALKWRQLWRELGSMEAVANKVGRHPKTIRAAFDRFDV